MSVVLPLSLALKAEKETKAIAANYQLVKSVTSHFIKLGTSNYETWRRKWEQEFKTLGWSNNYMSVDGPELDLSAEVDTESVHRKNAAKMVLKTIDANEHEPWLRDTDPTNPQAIFRRIHLKFRGTDTIAVSSQIESQLLTMTMKSTRLDVVAYGSAIVENLRKLKEMGAAMCEIKMVSLYLLGLSRVFDHIRFEIQKMIKNKKPKAPKTIAAVRKMVEDWAVQMKERNLLSYKDATGGDPKGIVHTLVGEVTKPSSDACRSWLKYGRCKPNELGKCSWKHDVKKKGINAPSPSVAGGTTKATAPSASTGKTLRDYCTLTCKECKVVGHSANWSGCPSKLAKAKSIMHTQPAPPAHPTVPSSSSAPSAKTPSILPVNDTMTVNEGNLLRSYNEKLLNILNVLANRSNGNDSSASSLMDADSMLKAFGNNPFGR